MGGQGFKKSSSKRAADHFRAACSVIPQRGGPPAEPVIPCLYKTENREKFEKRTKCWLQCLLEIRGSKILLDYLADFTERQAETEGFVQWTPPHSDLLTGIMFDYFQPETTCQRCYKSACIWHTQQSSCSCCTVTNASCSCLGWSYHTHLNKQALRPKQPDRMFIPTLGYDP